MSAPTAEAVRIDGLRRDVEALAAMVRDSAGPGERESAAWLADELSSRGVGEVRVEHFRFQRSWASAAVPHHLAVMGAALLGGRAGALIAAAAGVSYDLEFGGRLQWLRRLLPASEGANVLARVPAAGERERTLVLVAHHDAAQTGYLWASPFARTRPGQSLAAGPALATALVGMGCLAGRRAPRVAGSALLALSAFFALDVSRNETVPGASDNASGVAAVLELARRFAAEPLERTEVQVVLTGAEESGMGGMRAWLRAHAGALEPESTLVLGLDTLGAGEAVVLEGEGGVRTERYRERHLVWADRGAARAGLPAPRRFRAAGWTDPVLAAIAGLPTISLLSVRGNRYTNYHLPTDIPARVDWDSLERCTRLAGGVAEAFDAA